MVIPATGAGEIAGAAMLRRLIVWYLIGAVALALAATAARAADSCYSNPVYPCPGLGSLPPKEVHRLGRIKNRELRRRIEIVPVSQIVR